VNMWFWCIHLNQLKASPFMWKATMDKHCLVVFDKKQSIVQPEITNLKVLDFQKTLVGVLGVVSKQGWWWWVLMVKVLCGDCIGIVELGVEGVGYERT